MCVPGPTGKEQRPHKTLSQTCLSVSEGFLWRCGLAVACCRDSSSSPGRCVLPQAILQVAISPAIEPIDSRTGLPQSKQLTGKEHSPTHQQTIGLLSRALTSRAKSNFTHSQPLPSGSLHKPHPPPSVGRQKKHKVEFHRLQNKTTIRES